MVWLVRLKKYLSFIHTSRTQNNLVNTQVLYSPKGGLRGGGGGGGNPPPPSFMIFSVLDLCTGIVITGTQS